MLVLVLVLVNFMVELEVLALDYRTGNGFPSVALDLRWGWWHVNGRVMAEGLLGGKDGLRRSVYGLGSRWWRSVHGLRWWAVDGFGAGSREGGNAVGWFREGLLLRWSVHWPGRRRAIVGARLMVHRRRLMVMMFLTASESERRKQ